MGGKLESKALGIRVWIVDPDLPIVVCGTRPAKLVLFSVIENHQYVVRRSQYRLACPGINISPPNGNRWMCAAVITDAGARVGDPGLQDTWEHFPEHELIRRCSADVMHIFSARQRSIRVLDNSKLATVGESNLRQLRRSI